MTKLKDEYAFEVILVDDGSIDETSDMIKDKSVRDKRYKSIILSRNFGQQPAYSAAIDASDGDAVILMDGDLQDPPEIFALLIETYLKGYDVVFVKREKRKETIFLRASYALFYRIINALSDIDLPEDAGDFSIISRRVADFLSSSGERHRYLRGLRAWVGYKQTSITVQRDVRAAGKSNYGFLKLCELAANGIFSFSIKPIRVSILLGAIIIFGAILFSMYSVFAYFVFANSPKGFTALIAAISLFSGIQLLFLGVIGEYIGRVYEQVKFRPIYIVKESVGAGETKLKANGNQHLENQKIA